MAVATARLLGDILIDDGVIGEDILKAALERQSITGDLLGSTLMSMGAVTEDQLMEALGKQYSTEYVRLDEDLIDPDVARIIPEAMARKYRIVPLEKSSRAITIAMASPLDLNAQTDIRFRTALEVKPVFSKAEDIDRVLDFLFGDAGNWQSVFEEIGRDAGLPRKGGRDKSATEIEFMAHRAPIVKLVNLIINRAARERASDIHIEPEEDSLRVRYRIDGILHDILSPPANLHPVLVSRIKILARLDIAEKRLPQDGRIQMSVHGRVLDIRVSTLPTVHREAVVMRLLDRDAAMMSLSELGLADQDANLYRDVVFEPNGLILVTGPTGSGKSTTLYATLSAINVPDKKIITIEDPVEYKLKGVVQVQVNPDIGLTFASGLRSFLRQDPYIMMVGEIRDPETAELATRASLTGHLVFSTLHTNDSVSAIIRLVDIGVDRFLVSATLRMVLAQRLVRKVCVHCAEPCDSPPRFQGLLEASGLEVGEIRTVRSVGCRECNQSGYQGRTGLFELLIVSDAVRDVITNSRDLEEIRDLLKESGGRSIHDQALLTVANGETTFTEAATTGLFHMRRASGSSSKAGSGRRWAATPDGSPATLRQGDT